MNLTDGILSLIEEAKAKGLNSLLIGQKLEKETIALLEEEGYLVGSVGFMDNLTITRIRWY